MAIRVKGCTCTCSGVVSGVGATRKRKTAKRKTAKRKTAKRR